jgi:molybdopterin converting factor small subunit
MKIILRPFGTLQRYLGGSRIEILCTPGTTYYQLCEVIGERWGKRLPPGLWSSSSKRFGVQVIVMVDGKELAAQEDLVLCDGQEILLLLPFAGG